jgi:peptidyl-prolyl cis-trans isomerase D
MFDSIRSRHRLFSVAVMLLFVIPFIFTGVYSYNQFFSTDTSIAKVGSERISQQDLDLAFRERLERMAQMMGANFDASMFDNPQARAATLDSLLSERALKLEVQRAHLLVSDHKLQEVIGSTTAFQQGGHFDYETYKTLLASRGLNERAFETDLRSDLAKQTLIGAVGDSAVLPKSVSDRLWQLQHEKREVRELAFKPDAYLGKTEVSDEAIRADYEKNKARYMTPETVRAEYVVLRVADLASQMAVAPDEVHAFYEHNLKRWGQLERRRASHILITVGPGGSAPDKTEARKLAESVLTKVRSSPADFPRLAKEYSKDPGSAQKGGDLGWFGRGMMVKPFEDSVFSMKDGQTSGLVESDFGFHIIRVTGIEAARTKPFEEVKDQIEGELRQQAAEKRFSELAEQFSNFVYEQADGLKPAADKFKLQLHEVDGLTRHGPSPQTAEAAVFTPAVLEAIFAPDSVQKRKNIKAIEIGGNALISARVLDHHAAAPIPLEVVKPNIKGSLQRVAASEMARKAGQARLAELQKSPGDDGFDAPRFAGRDDVQQLPPAALNSIMQLAPGRLPAFVGVDSGDGGYLVLHVLSIKPADAPVADAVAGASQQWLQTLSSADEAAYVQGLRQRLGAKVVRGEAAPAGKGEEQSRN